MKYSEATLSGIVGGIQGDHLEMWCKECGNQIPQLRFHSEDTSGVQLEGECRECRRSFNFKLSVAPPLRPTSSGKL